MGYVARDALPVDADYRAAPPDSRVPATQLLADGALAVAMHSRLGPFVLLVGR